MQTIKNRKGLALGAALSLLASLFVGAAPASATTDGQYLALTPVAGPVTNFNGTTAEDFELVAYVLPGQATWTDSDTVHFEVTKVSGAMDVLIDANSISTAIAAGATPASASGEANASISGVITHTTVSLPVTVSHVASASNGAVYLNLRAYTASPGVVSSSPSVTLTIKVWKENIATSNGRWDALEWYTTKTVVLHSMNSVPTTVSIGSPEVGDTVVTASGTVSALNFENLTGKFYLQVTASAAVFVDGPLDSTMSATAIGQDTMADLGGVVSQSFAIETSGGIAAGTSFSGYVTYDPAGNKVAGSGLNAAANTYRLGSLATAVAAGTETDTLLVQAISTSNSIMPGASTATVRANTTTTYKVTATSTSGLVTTSISGAVLSVAISQTAGTGLSLNAKEISVNGAAATTSYPAALALTTGTDGTATFTLATSGFVGDENLSIVVSETNISDSLTVNVRGVVPTLTADYSQVSVGAGETAAIGFTVEDQWGVAYAGTDLRVAMTKGGVAGFSHTNTLSYVAVTAGKATFNFTPSPATKTGSATVTARLQQLQAATGAYVNETNGADVVVNVNVTSVANAFGTGLAASYSASVSYPTTYAPAVAMGGKVTNTGSAVVVSGAGLIFEDASGATASDTITVRADGSLNYSVNVYGMKEGSHVVTFTNGSATTTSLLVVSAASSDMGRSIVWDTTNVAAGRTAIVTGTLLDDNGNPVSTVIDGSTAGDSGTASIVVSFTGTAGIPVGAMPVETDADGKFQVSLLTAAADRGSFTLTATYAPQGAATVVANLITSVNTITVGAASTAPASDQKLTVGSFKGFVAIYALNYTGQKLSAKVAGKWLVVNELSKFQRVVRNTGAGFTIKVDLYIDGAFVRSETVVTK